jgi:ribonuclease J
MLYEGVAVLTLVIDGLGNLEGLPQLTTHGLLDEEEMTSMAISISEDVEGILFTLSEDDKMNDQKVRETVRTLVRRKFKDNQKKRPLTSIHLVRISNHA